MDGTEFRSQVKGMGGSNSSHPFGGDSKYIRGLKRKSTLHLSQNIDIYIYIYIFLDKGYIGWVVII